MEQLYRFLYCSKVRLTGTSGVSPVAIGEILAASRRNNSRNGLTGALLYSEDGFAQVLEGSCMAIDATFDRIRHDQRHHKITVLGLEPIITRDFPEWSMAFAGICVANNSLVGGTHRVACSALVGESEQVLRLLKQVVTCKEEWLMPT